MWQQLVANHSSAKEVFVGGLSSEMQLQNSGQGCGFESNFTKYDDVRGHHQGQDWKA
jgi:hypothetical protein